MKAKWITSLAPTTGGFTVTFSITLYTITNGPDGAVGADAVKWEIGTDGCLWHKNDKDRVSGCFGRLAAGGVGCISLYR